MLKQYDELQDVRASEQFFAKLAPYMLDSRLKKVRWAYELSKYGHRNQVRKGGGRVFDHPRAAALISIEELQVYDWEVIVALLLHDIQEDSWILTERRIALNFGDRVAFWVKCATKSPGYEEWYIPRFIAQGDWQPIFVKLCDRLHNIRTVGGFDPPKQESYIAETREQYLPLVPVLIERLPEARKWAGHYLQQEIEKICNEYA